MPLTELPPKVKSLLPLSLQTTWLEAFNTALNEGRPDCYAHAWAVALEEAFPGNDKVVLNLNDSDYSFAIDLAGMQFDEDPETVTWVQAMPLGTWHHPVHGEIAVTPDKVQEFADNVNSNVRGQDLDIDYDHKAKTTEAAGWIKGAQARSDGLWVGVQWTQSALAKLKEKAFRYFSPEFTDTWTHPSTNVTHKNVLFGGALTNRPYLKGILPINLSEVIPHTGETMLEELRKLLGLPDTATEAEILAAATEKMGTDPSEGEGSEGEGEGGTEGEPAPATETGQRVPVTANESEQVKQLNERIALLEAANRVSEVTVRLNEINSSPKKKFALAPASIEKLKALALDSPTKKFSDDLFKFVEEIVTAGVVDLSEHGGKQGDSSTGDGTAASEYMTKVQAYAEEKKVPFIEAANAVALNEPDLFDRYRNEAYIKTRGEDN